MPAPEAPREEALRRLRERAAALETSTARPVAQDPGHAAVGQAYGVIGQLIGGPLVGLGFGFGVDWLLRTAPWATIIGVLLGFGVAVFLAWRTAERLRGPAVAASAAPVLDDDEDEER